MTQFTPKFLIAALAALTLSACGINSVPTAEEAAKAKWADVQSQYQRRADLIDNLVETVKGAASSEQEILTGVVEARAKACQDIEHSNIGVGFNGETDLMLDFGKRLIEGLVVGRERSA